MARRSPEPTTSRHPAASDDAATRPNERFGWAKNLLNRSIVIEKRRNQLHVALVDRSPQAMRQRAQSELVQMRDELRARLLVHDQDAEAVRNLFAAHKALEAEGWSGVESLPPKVAARAVVEAQMLQRLEPSEVMARIVERLATAKDAAESRAELESRSPRSEWELPPVPEVSEASHEEYELMERSWMGTMPAELDATGAPTVR